MLNDKGQDFQHCIQDVSALNNQLAQSEEQFNELKPQHPYSGATIRKQNDAVTEATCQNEGQADQKLLDGVETAKALLDTKVQVTSSKLTELHRSLDQSVIVPNKRKLTPTQ